MSYDATLQMMPRSISLVIFDLSNRASTAAQGHRCPPSEPTRTLSNTLQIMRPKTGWVSPHPIPSLPFPLSPLPLRVHGCLARDAVAHLVQLQPQNRPSCVSQARDVRCRCSRRGPSQRRIHRPDHLVQCGDDKKNGAGRVGGGAHLSLAAMGAVCWLYVSWHREREREREREG